MFLAERERAVVFPIEKLRPKWTFRSKLVIEPATGRNLFEPSHRELLRLNSREHAHYASEHFFEAGQFLF
jgi:hypothetical protein